MKDAHDKYRRDKVIEGAKKYKLADDDLIELYRRIQMLVYHNEKKYGYKCYGSGIGKNIIDFSIEMPKGKKPPKELGELFFEKIDMRYKVEFHQLDAEYAPENKDAYMFYVRFY